VPGLFVRSRWLGWGAMSSLLPILRAWWPLAASWLFMSIEQPLVGSVLARLADPTVHLAALGGIVFPLALVIEAPIIMLLAASTALSKDRQAYRLIYRFMMIAGLLLTLLHALIAFTPLYDLIIVGLLRTPEAVVEPARWGLMIMLPFTWSIAYRRFHQGLLIRHGHSLVVSMGTLIRLGAIVLGVLTGLALGAPGIVVGTLGVSAGVIAEAIFIGLRVQPIVRTRLSGAPEQPLTWGRFARFYTPLALTSLILLMVQPLGSAALSRMPQALESLAAWPVLAAFIFLFRGLGMAYNEVVVAQLERPGAWRDLRRFAILLSLVMTLLLLVVALSPLAGGYFGRVMGLERALAALASSGLLWAFLWPALTVWQSYYQGILVHSGRTQGISQSVLLSLATSATLLVLGASLGSFPGLYVVTVAFVTGSAAQVIWLFYVSRPARQALRAEEEKVVVGEAERTVFAK
jgi:hypothetical protein